MSEWLFVAAALSLITLCGWMAHRKIVQTGLWETAGPLRDMGWLCIGAIVWFGAIILATRPVFTTVFFGGPIALAFGLFYPIVRKIQTAETALGYPLHYAASDTSRNSANVSGAVFIHNQETPPGRMAIT